MTFSLDCCNDADLVADDELVDLTHRMTEASHLFDQKMKGGILCELPIRKRIPHRGLYRLLMKVPITQLSVILSFQ